MAESDVNRLIHAACAKVGLLAVRVHSGIIQLPGRVVRLAPKGTPDHVVLCPHGQCVWVEAKVPGRELSPEQREWARKVTRLGHVVERVDSLDSMLEALKRNHAI